MSKKTRNSLLVAKIETIYGTDPTPAAATNSILCRNLVVQPLNIETADRDTVRPWYGNSPQVVAARYSVAEFEIELAGSGTAGTAAKWGPILRACGFSETISASTSVTYAPISTAQESLTLWYYLDGLLHKITGARGNVSFEMTAKGIPIMKFRLVGLYNAPSDTTMATGVAYTGFTQPVAFNKQNTPTFSLHSVSAKVESFNLDMGNEVGYINRVNSEEVVITDRNVTGNIQFEVDTLAAKDWYAAILAGTASTLSIIHGTTAGNICTLAGSKVQLQSPQYQEKDGIAMFSAPLSIQPTSGNDETSLVIT
jgi:hypothetical protein